MSVPILDGYQCVGLIYLLESKNWHADSDKHIYKYGYSVNMESRLKQYKTHNPFEVIPRVIYGLYAENKKIINNNHVTIGKCAEGKLHGRLTLEKRREGLNGGIEFYSFEAYENHLLIFRDLLLNVCLEMDLQMIKIPSKDMFNVRIEGLTIHCRDVFVQRELEILYNEKTLILRPDQQEDLEKILKVKRCKIVNPCGWGKSLIISAISMRDECKMVLILVPTVALVDQFKNKKYLSDAIYIDHTKKKIDIKKIGERAIVVSTYQSSSIFELKNIHWDVVICDEAHHVAGNEDGYFYDVVGNNNFDRVYFFTATEKVYNFGDEHKENVVCMSDENIFGKCLIKRTIDEGIQRGFLTNYNVVLMTYEIGNKDDALMKIIRENNCIGKRILIKTSRIETRINVVKMLKKEFEDKIYINEIDANYRQKKRDGIITEFREYNGISILVICSVLKEGWDEQSVDTVIPYDCPESNLELVQLLGRMTRRYSGKELSQLILMFSDDEWKNTGGRIKRVLRAIADNNLIFRGRMRKKITSEKLVNGVDIGRNGKIIEINDDVENILMRTEIFDRFMNLLKDGGKYSCVENDNALLEFVKKEKRVPKYKEIYVDENEHRFNVGINWNNLKTSETDGNKKRRDELCKKSEILQDDYQKYILNKQIRDDIHNPTTEEKDDALLKFVEKEKRSPKDKKIYVDSDGDKFNVGQNWLHLKTRETDGMKKRRDELCKRSEILLDDYQKYILNKQIRDETNNAILEFVKREKRPPKRYEICTNSYGNKFMVGNNWMNLKTCKTDGAKKRRNDLCKKSKILQDDYQKYISDKQIRDENYKPTQKENDNALLEFVKKEKRVPKGKEIYVDENEHQFNVSIYWMNLKTRETNGAKKRRDELCKKSEIFHKDYQRYISNKR